MRLAALAACLCLAACDGSAVVGINVPYDALAEDADAADDALADGPSFDVGPPRDLPGDRADAPSGGCANDLDCARGQRCLQGRCAEDVCVASETPCGADRCAMRCVPMADLCAGVRCGAEETCFGGRCVPGCFPAPCAGIRCPAGQFCDDTTGMCAPVRACPGDCGPGFACHVACSPRTACDRVTCPEGEVCAEGRCVRNPCAGVACPPTSLCVDGRCQPTCGCDPPCTRSPRDRCVVGRCVCNRLCTSSSRCGDDDGCGGRCVGRCDNPFATCDPVDFTCSCTPSCPLEGGCGADDGCGGRCDQGCDVGERCDTTLGRCLCVTRCPPPERFVEFPCGAQVPNLCPGGPVCGVGTGCPMGQRCNPTTFRCDCVGDCPSGDPDAGGGPPGGGCSPGLMLCESRCTDLALDGNNCGACGTQCPFGTRCEGGRCVCPSPQTLCGARCVITANDNANCGGCGNVCAPRTNCEGGRCVCVPACLVDPNSVACGTPLANACPGGPSCGVGRDCPEGESCDARAARCLCVPRCPAGVRCGTADGCGGQCIGACGAGEACSQDPMNPARYFCSEGSCTSGCRCDEVCAMNRCVRITCAAGDAPCPCRCCPPGQMCVGGSACVPIPP